MTDDGYREGGDCYEAAVDYMIAHPTATLAHGSVHDGHHGHAWVESTEVVAGFTLAVCIDKSGGHDTILPRGGYYALGRITDVTRYTYRQMLELLHSSGHYGPWEGD